LQGAYGTTPPQNGTQPRHWTGQTIRQHAQNIAKAYPLYRFNASQTIKLHWQEYMQDTWLKTIKRNKNWQFLTHFKNYK